MKPSFDVVLIMKNEAKTLPRLLSSLEEFKSRGGLVYIVDTGSTDDSVKVARDWGCIVEEVGERFMVTITKEQANEINTRFVVEDEKPVLKEGDRLFNFAEARNFASGLAENDWVWSPDADEAFTQFDLEAIEEVIKNPRVSRLSYQFVFAHDAQGLPSVQFLHSKMFRRSMMKWVGCVHEVLSGTGDEIYLSEDKVLLEHFQNTETVRSGYLKGLAYASLAGQSSAESPDRAAHYFARELMYTGRPKSAIKEFERHIAMNAWQPERSQSAVFIGQCYEILEDVPKAIESYHRALQIDASRREPLLKLARLFYRANDPQRVALYVEAALTIPLSGYYSNNAEDYRHVPHELGYWAYYYLGNKEKSKEHFDKAWAFYPNHEKYLKESEFFYELPSVSILIPSLGRPEGLEKCLQSIKKLSYPEEKIEICVLDETEPTVPQKIADGVAKTKGEYIAYAANDMEFSPDSLKIAILSSLIREKALVAFHGGPLSGDLGNICEHFVIRRDFIPKIGGKVFDTDFTHVGCDNLLWAKASKQDQAYHEVAAQITHHHFSKGAEFDWVYERAWKHADRDRELLKAKLKELEVC